LWRKEDQEKKEERKEEETEGKQTVIMIKI
jgi:hypothetical protein